MESRQVVGTVLGTVVKVVVAAIILMVVYNYSITAYEYGYRIFGEEPVDPEPGREISVTVTEEYNAEDIGKLLEQKGLIRDANLFVVHEKLASGENGVAPGTYDLNTAMTVEEMVEIMVASSESEMKEETGVAEE